MINGSATKSSVSNRQVLRHLSLAIGKGYLTCFSPQFPVEFKFPDERIYIPKVFHPAVGESEFDHRFKFLGDDRSAPDFGLFGLGSNGCDLKAYRQCDH